MTAPRAVKRLLWLRQPVALGSSNKGGITSGAAICAVFAVIILLWLRQPVAQFITLRFDALRSFAVVAARMNVSHDNAFHLLLGSLARST